jgi:micrococcal nuclease
MTKRFYYEARVTEVVDGDTIGVTIDLGLNNLYRTRLRLNGIDTPEVWRPSTKLEKIAGDLVAKHLSDLILDKDIIIKTEKNSKYGEYLADLFFTEADEVSINRLFLQEEIARFYIGDKKIPWTEEQLNKIIGKLS